eukprot:gene5009-27159_t
MTTLLQRAWRPVSQIAKMAELLRPVQGVVQTGAAAAIIQSPSNHQQVRTRKAGIHPRLQQTFLLMSDGSTVNIASPLFSAGPLKLQDDIKNQSPWSPDSSGIIDTSGQVAKYQQRSIQETFVVAEEDDDWDDDEDW